MATANAGHVERRYIYSALDVPDTIRLMLLQPSANLTSPLRFSFSQARTSVVRGQYEALSYTWGEAQFPCTLQHSEDQTTLLPITSNLHQALCQLRRTSKVRTLWVDAVCINQDDDEEKSKQIPLMARIFRGARRVVAWLGPVDDGSNAEQGMKLLDELSSEWNYSDYHNQDETLELTLNLVNDLLSLPWFTRLWIIQEIAMNPDTVLHCGASKLTLTRLIAGLSTLRNKMKTHVSYSRMMQMLEPLQKVAQLWYDHGLNEASFIGAFTGPSAQNLFDLVDSFQSYACTDARDRIFALYNLVSPPNSWNTRPLPISFEINYSKSVQQTYHGFAIACLRSEEVHCSQIIRAAILRNFQMQQENWPSWVPDWRIKTSGHVNLPDILGFYDDREPQKLLITVPTPWNAESCDIVVERVIPDTPAQGLAGQTFSLVDYMGQIITLFKEYFKSWSARDVTTGILLEILRGRHYDLRYHHKSSLRAGFEAFIAYLWNTGSKLTADSSSEEDVLLRDFGDVIRTLRPRTENLYFFSAQHMTLLDGQIAFGVSGVFGVSSIRPEIGDRILPHAGGHDNIGQMISPALILRPTRGLQTVHGPRSFRLIGNAVVTAPLVDGSPMIVQDDAKRYSTFFLE